MDGFTEVKNSKRNSRSNIPIPSENPVTLSNTYNVIADLKEEDVVNEIQMPILDDPKENSRTKNLDKDKASTSNDNDKVFSPNPTKPPTKQQYKFTFTTPQVSEQFFKPTDAPFIGNYNYYPPFSYNYPFQANFNYPSSKDTEEQSQTSEDDNAFSIKLPQFNNINNNQSNQTAPINLINNPFNQQMPQFNQHFNNFPPFNQGNTNFFVNNQNHLTANKKMKKPETTISNKDSLDINDSNNDEIVNKDKDNDTGNFNVDLGDTKEELNKKKDELNRNKGTNENLNEEKKTHSVIINVGIDDENNYSKEKLLHCENNEYVYNEDNKIETNERVGNEREERYQQLLNSTISESSIWQLPLTKSLLDRLNIIDTYESFVSFTKTLDLKNLTLISLQRLYQKNSNRTSIKLLVVIISLVKIFHYKEIDTDNTYNKHFQSLYNKWRAIINGIYSLYMDKESNVFKEKADLSFAIHFSDIIHSINLGTTKMQGVAPYALWGPYKMADGINYIVYKTSSSKYISISYFEHNFDMPEIYTEEQSEYKDMYVYLYPLSKEALGTTRTPVLCRQYMLDHHEYPHPKLPILEEFGYYDNTTKYITGLRKQIKSTMISEDEYKIIRQEMYKNVKTIYINLHNTSIDAYETQCLLLYAIHCHLTGAHLMDNPGNESRDVIPATITGLFKLEIKYWSEVYSFLFGTSYNANQDIIDTMSLKLENYHPSLAALLRSSALHNSIYRQIIKRPDYIYRAIKGTDFDKIKDIIIGSGDKRTNPLHNNNSIYYTYENIILMLKIANPIVVINSLVKERINYLKQLLYRPNKPQKELLHAPYIDPKFYEKEKFSSFPMGQVVKQALINTYNKYYDSDKEELLNQPLSIFEYIDLDEELIVQGLIILICQFKEKVGLNNLNLEAKEFLSYLVFRIFGSQIQSSIYEKILNYYVTLEHRPSDNVLSQMEENLSKIGRGKVNFNLKSLFKNPDNVSDVYNQLDNGLCETFIENMPFFIKEGEILVFNYGYDFNKYEDVICILLLNIIQLVKKKDDSQIINDEFKGILKIPKVNISKLVINKSKVFTKNQKVDALRAPYESIVIGNINKLHITNNIWNQSLLSTILNVSQGATIDNNISKHLWVNQFKKNVNNTTNNKVKNPNVNISMGKKVSEIKAYAKTVYGVYNEDTHRMAMAKKGYTNIEYIPENELINESNVQLALNQIKDMISQDESLSISSPVSDILDKYESYGESLYEDLNKSEIMRLRFLIGTLRNPNNNKIDPNNKLNRLHLPDNIINEIQSNGSLSQSHNKEMMRMLNKLIEDNNDILQDYDSQEIYNHLFKDIDEYITPKQTTLFLETIKSSIGGESTSSNYSVKTDIKDITNQDITRYLNIVKSNFVVRNLLLNIFRDMYHDVTNFNQIEAALINNPNALLILGAIRNHQLYDQTLCNYIIPSEVFDSLGEYTMKMGNF